MLRSEIAGGLTNSENAAARAAITKQIAAFEAAHRGEELRPWLAGDSPISLEHWGMVQTRIALKSAKKLSDDQRTAIGQRLKNARRSSSALIETTTTASPACDTPPLVF